MRNLNEYEQHLVEKMLCKNINNDFKESVKNCLVDDVSPQDKDWHHFRFQYEEHPWQGGGFSVIADWRSLDSDGALLTLLALGDEEGRPYEIEICRPDGKDIIAFPGIDNWLQN